MIYLLTRPLPPPTPIPSRSLTEPFRDPVDWKALGLFDYPQVIKKPMDLGLVKQKVNSGKYKSIHEAADDVRLIWKNCMTYNADGSDFYNLAQVSSTIGFIRYQTCAFVFTLVSNGNLLTKRKLVYHPCPNKII